MIRNSFLFLLTLLPMLAFPATVIFPPTAFNGAASRQPVTVTNTSNPALSASNWYTMPAKDYPSTNTYGGVSNVAIAVLHAGSYVAKSGPYSTAFNVPDDTNTYWLAALATNGNTIGAITGKWVSTNNLFSFFQAGTNVTFDTNAGKLRISSSGTGGGTTYTNTDATVGVISGSGIGSNLTSLATVTGLTTVSNQVLAVSNSIYGSISNALAAADGIEINAVSFGADPYGMTDNSALFSLLFSTYTNVYIPPGDYYCPSTMTISNRCNIDGYGAVFYNHASSNIGGIWLNVLNPDCKIRGLTFLDDRLTNSAAAIVRINGVGFPVVEDIDFYDSSGTSVKVYGDSSIYQRSNHLTLHGLYFSDCYGAIDALETQQGLQFGIISKCNGNGLLNHGIKLGSANVRIANDVIMVGVRGDGTGSAGNPVYSGMGLYFSVSNLFGLGISHSDIQGQFVHFASNVVENASGGVSTMLGLGPVTFSCTRNFFIGWNGLKFTGKLLESYASSAPATVAIGCSNSVFSSTDFRGPMTGFESLIGADCTSNNVPLVPNSGSWTNFLTKTGNGGSLTNLTTNSSPSLAASIYNASTNKVDMVAGIASNLTLLDNAVFVGQGGETLQIAAGDIFTARTNGRIYGFNFSGNGSLVSNLNANLLESGTVPTARFTTNGVIATNQSYALVMHGTNAPQFVSTMTNITLVSPASSNATNTGTLYANGLTFLLTNSPSFNTGTGSNFIRSPFAGYLGFSTTSASLSSGVIFGTFGNIFEFGRADRATAWQYESSLAGKLSAGGPLNMGANVVSNTPSVGLNLSLAPVAPAGNGAVLFTDGTNIVAVLQNASGVKTTNRLTLGTSWP